MMIPIQYFEYVNNSKVSMLPDNLKDKIGEFFVVDDYIYYIPTNLIGSDRYFNVDLRRIHFDGSGEELLANDLLYANSKCFYTNGGIVYISYNQENDESNVVYLNLETKEKTILPSEISHNFVVYRDKIYFSMGGLLNPKPDFSIMAYNLSDGTEEMILNSSSNILSSLLRHLLEIKPDSLIYTFNSLFISFSLFVLIGHPFYFSFKL